MAIGTTLVTGASGFAGSHLLDRLAGHAPVVAWHRPGSPTPPRVADVEWHSVNLLDRAAVRHAIDAAHPSRIYHLAGAPHVDTAWKSVVPHLETNVLGTHYLLEAVRQAGAPCRVLVVTSGMIYAASEQPLNEDAPLVPSSPYGLSKLAQDRLAFRAFADDGLDVVIARAFNHAGPRQDPGFVVSSFARQIALIEAGQAPAEVRVGNLDARRDLTDVRDVVEAYEHLMETGSTGRPYNVCSGRAIRIGDLLDHLLRLAQTPVRVAPDDTRLRPSDVPVFAGDPTRIRTELGWIPRIPIDQLLHDTLAWWRTAVGAVR